MKNSLKLVGTINLISACIMALSSKTIFLLPINIAVLTVTSFVCFEYSKSDIVELNKKKYVLLFLSVLLFFSNVVSGIVLFIMRDNIKEQYNKIIIKNDYKTSDIKEKKTDPEIRRIDLLLKLGVFLVFLSGYIFATTRWSIMPGFAKLLLLLILGGLFSILSLFTEQRLKLIKTAFIYWLLGMTFFVFAVVSVGYFAILGNWLTFSGMGSLLLYALLFSVITILSFITYKKYKKDIFLHSIFTFFLLTFISLLMFGKVELGIIFLLLNLILLTINIYAKKNNIQQRSQYNFGLISSYILFFLFLNAIDLINIKAMILVNSSVFITNLLYLVKYKDKEYINIVTPIFINLLLAYSFLKLGIEKNLFCLLLFSFSSLFYLLIKISKLVQGNEEFNITHSICYAFLNIVVFVYSLSSSYLIASLLALFMLIINLFNCIKTNHLNKNVIDYYMQPISVLLLEIGILNYINQNIIALSFINFFFLITLIYGLLNIIVKEKKLKIEYYIFFAIFLAITSFLNIFYFESLSTILLFLLNIYLFSLAFFDKRKLYNKFIIPTYLFMLLSIYVTFEIINILSLTKVMSSLLVISIYLLLVFINRKNAFLSTATYFIMLLPVNTLIKNMEVASYYKTIYKSIFYFYLVYILCAKLFKNSTDRNEISCVLCSFILFLTMFKSRLIIGIFVGVVSLILLLIGFFKKDYKSLFFVGIVSTLINIIYHLKHLWAKIPFWLYLLVAGSTLITIVTYKEIIKQKKTK